MRWVLFVAILMCIPILAVSILVALAGELADVCGCWILGRLDAWELATRRGGAGV